MPNAETFTHPGGVSVCPSVPPKVYAEHDQLPDGIPGRGHHRDGLRSGVKCKVHDKSPSPCTVSTAIYYRVTVLR